MKKALLLFVAISIALFLEAGNDSFPCFGYAIGNCNVRSAPSTKSSIVFVIEDDEEVQVEKRKGNFYYIYAPSRGWGWTHVSNLQLGESYDDDDDYDDDDYDEDETSGQEQILKNIATPIANAFAQAGYGKITSTNYSEYSGYKIEVELKRPVKIDISYVFPGAIYYRTESKNNSYNNFGTWVHYTRYEEYWGYNGYEIEIDSTTHSTTIYIYVKPEEW
ncbi:MAG: SH3 domain-containing protein [Muribaculaceae bacterium]|nr:SH3 domain-containing protein [Muribaculaceae bacterium]